MIFLYTNIFSITCFYSVIKSAHTVTGSEAVPLSTHESRVRRIVNGIGADILEFPFQVQIIYSGRFVCSGTIISSDWILTAAHCLQDGTARNYLIMIKSSFIYKEKRIRVLKVVAHKDYSAENRTNDIGLLQVEPITPYDQYTQPVTMIGPWEELEVGTPVISTGWGQTEYSRISRSLRRVDIFTVSKEDCEKSYEGYFTIVDSQLCAMYRNEHKSPCPGDSGGPIVTENKTLVGVVSYGPRCDLPGYPDVNTKISHFREWIMKIAGV